MNQTPLETDDLKVSGVRSVDLALVGKASAASASEVIMVDNIDILGGFGGSN